MTFTAYAGPSGASVDATALVPWNGTSGAGPSAGVYLYGFIDGSQRARFFYSSTANTIALPTLVVPPVVPLNFVNCGNSAVLGAVYQLVQTGSDYGATVAGNGPFLVTLSFSAGSPDSASPFQFTLDAQALLLVASTAYNGA
jgi:hypothetical protein